MTVKQGWHSTRWGEQRVREGGKRRVHRVVQMAIREGLLTPQPCEECASGDYEPDPARKIVAHHNDCNDPLKVRWLCQSHHVKWHWKNKAIKMAKELAVLSVEELYEISKAKLLIIEHRRLKKSNKRKERP